MSRALLSLALGAALCWSALRAASLQRPSLAAADAGSLWDKAKELRVEGRHRQALHSVQELLASYPDNPIYLSFAAELYGELKDPAREAAAWELFMPVAPFPTDACPRLGQAYRALGKIDKALDADNRCLELDPSKTDLIFFKGHELERQDRCADATVLYQKILERVPDHSDATLGLARCKLSDGDVAGAKLLVDRVLAGNPRNTDALASAARISEKSDDYKSAQQFLREAILQSPSYTDLYLMMGRVSLEAGDKDEARKAYTTLHDIDSKDPTAARKLKELEQSGR
jgi:tetratricopeptide (TPR) repeat protein